jgi:Protein of unknown function (DUF1628).
MMIDSLPEFTATRRAVSAVVGVALLITLVIVLSSTITGLVLAFDTPTEPAFTAPNASEDANPFSDSDDLLAPENPSPDASDVKYAMRFEISDGSDAIGNSLNEVRIEVADVDGDLFANVGEAEFEKFTINPVDGSEQSIIDDVDSVSVENDDTALVVGVTGNYDTDAAGDVVSLIFDGVNNPADPGTYDVSVTLNDEATQNGELEITAS